MGKSNLLQGRILGRLLLAACCFLQIAGISADNTRDLTGLPVTVTQSNDRVVKILNATAVADSSSITVSGELQGRKPRQRLKSARVPYTLTIRLLSAAGTERAISTERYPAHALHNENGKTIRFNQKFQLSSNVGDTISVSLARNSSQQQKP